jgi:transcriptional regulator of acetoin/glycerol metabolism
VWSLPAVASAAEAGAVSAQAAAAGRTLAPPRSLQQRLFEQERAEIIDAIERCEGNIAGAARTLGVNRSTLYYRLRKHDLLHLLPTRPEPEPDDGG